MSERNIPFTFPIDVTHVAGGGRDYRLTADAAQRAAVAADLGIEAIGRLMANVTVSPEPGGVVASGRLDAEVTQACVVSLAPVLATLSIGFTRHFVPGAAPVASKRGKAADGDDEEEGGWVDPNEEVLDPIVGGMIDLGELVTEELALALDPYPRAPGATFRNPVENEDAGASGPFAALAKLRPATPRRVPGNAPAKRDKRS